VLVVMDGIGRGKGDAADAVAIAATPTLDRLWVPGVRAELRAHGKAVGLPSDDDMGNSEVGHNALGAGKVYAQGAVLVGRAIQSGKLFEGQAWQGVIGRGARGGAIHFLGLTSDGNVHSHLDHLEALLGAAARAGCKKLYVHALLDGRDVSPTSALEYIDRMERYLAQLRDSGIDARIVSGGGRMQITMDRYEADWPMVERGWHTHVLADARPFASATQAVETLRGENPGVIDQDLPAFVVEPRAPMQDGDACVMFNFRGDRAIEISRAFDDVEWDKFDRVRKPDVFYAGMMEYDGDLHIPQHYLVSPPEIERPMGEILAAAHVSQLAISETQKYGHVTYFWNGNKSGKFDDKLEVYKEIPSDVVPFEQRPWMKAAEITDDLIKAVTTGKHRTLRVNYANGDMVGHTGSFQSAVIAIETLDIALSRLLPVVDAARGVAIITADHGNADEMYELDKKGQPVSDGAGGFKAKTSHTLNPVPCILYDNQTNGALRLRTDKKFGLSALASTTVNLLGYDAPTGWDDSLLIAG
jgi:2,3-bisphosphoglycerate-independent phosphoglycerate mutase